MSGVTAVTVTVACAARKIRAWRSRTGAGSAPMEVHCAAAGDAMVSHSTDKMTRQPGVMTSILPSTRPLARRLAALVIAAALGCGAFGAAEQRSAPRSVRDLGPVRDYIKHGWAALTRSNHDLPAAVPDPKFHDHRAGDPWPLYLPPLESRARVEAELGQLLGADDLKSIALRTLPSSPQAVTEPGLLYLPRPYVVPGGRFNEMYGWDSYFIQVGLLRDDEVQLARDMVDNFVYEIANYGTILNANRTYYLTRAQPPFLTEMILGVFERTHDRAWL